MQRGIERGLTPAEVRWELRLAREDLYERSPAILKVLVERTLEPRMAWESLKRYFGNNPAKKATATKK